MKYLVILLSCGLLFACQPSEQTAETEQSNSNPFFVEYNAIVDFAAITAENVVEATEVIQAQSDQAVQAIIEIDESNRTFENTMRALDDSFADYNKIASAIYLMSYTHPDSAIRTNALNANTILQQYINKVQLNEDLYKAIKSYSQSDEAKKLTGYQAKFVEETVREFERNGFALSAADRDILKVINDEIAEIGDTFSKNIASYQDALIATEDDVAGMPDDYKEQRRQEDGTYTIDLSYPSYRPFMKLSESESARKKLYFKYMNRAAPENLEVLQNLLKKRKEMAELLGYRSYAAYLLESRMAKNPETVWEFETKLKTDLREKAEADYKERLTVKQGDVPSATELKSWESGYYADKLLKEKYQLDGELVKQYFALNDVLDGLFTITQTIFDLKFREVENPSVWHEEVRLFEVFQDGKLKGRFYLDLHPRANKYNHAACFGIINGKMTQKGYQIPTASLVCNFPKATEEKPALMPHSQVETFFHEFGHVLHQMLTTAELVSQSGTNVARDFVEAPSQIFENWVWNYEALKLFSKHYETGEVLPKELFEKMLAAKNVGRGLASLGQVFYGTLDMTLHDKFDPNTDETTTDVLKKVQNEILINTYTEGTYMQAAFGHLRGYGASYYGYMWSQVYAQDMFSVFEENGILDKETGIRYRDIILASGSSKNELDLVREFLGREPNNEAFLRDLGL